MICHCRSASLAELYDFPDKLVTCMRSTMQGPLEGALFSSAWLYVLSCFQQAEADSVQEQPCSMAVRLGEDYMKGVADKVKTLLLRLSEVEHTFFLTTRSSCWANHTAQCTLIKSCCC